MAKTVVLVTGGNRGIGLEIVKALLGSAPLSPGTSSDSDGTTAPYHVYLGSRDLQKGRDVAAKLRAAHGNTVSAVQLDITSPESVSSAAATVKAESGRLDILVNNAGVSVESPDEAAKMSIMYDVNVIGAWRVVDTFKPLLLAAKDGGEEEEEEKEQKKNNSNNKRTKVRRIIHVSSVMGSTALRFDPSSEFYHHEFTAYRCSKAALDMLAACHAYELRDEGVKVHAFDPGWAATEFGGGDPSVTREMGAVDPSVSGNACRDIIEGKRDAESDVLISINGDAYPW
ncbi:NAD(P)-binding protein [Nemania sp. NC0429]|nr:NAD(P)-binding protein [Nemania sp. NC0429]